MKIQTTAQVTNLIIDGEQVKLDSARDIEFEFSAIDTGGAFRDPILDFSFRIPQQKWEAVSREDRHELELRLSDPDDESRTTNFSYEGALAATEDHDIEANGRLKEEQLSREVIGFVLQLLR